MAPRVAVLLLNWRGLSDTLECLRSLESIDYPNFWVIVVDNGSGDGSEEAIRAAYPQHEVLQTGRNLGFAGGNNIGIDHAMERGADYVWLLNNDTEVDAATLTALVAGVTEAGAGIVGSKIYFHDAPRTLWFAGGEIDWGRRRERHRGYREVDCGQFDERALVDYVSGCSLLVSRAVIEQVGKMDEGFFLYFEETDWCIRATAAGFRVLFEPRSRVWHKISATTGKFTPTAMYYYARNNLVFFARHGHRGPGFKKFAFTALLFAKYYALLTLHLLVRAHDGRGWWRSVVALTAGMWAYRRGDFGPLGPGS